MVVGGRVQIQQSLQKAVDVGGREQVLATAHQGHSLQMVVKGDRQVIACRRILAGQHHVAE